MIRTCLLPALLLLAACSSKPAVEKEPAPPPSANPTGAAVTPTATAAPAPKTIPTLTAKPFEPGGTKLDAMYPLEGGIAVTADQRVGHLQGDAVTWVGKIPEGSPAFGRNRITSVRGRVPDLLSALYVSGQGRAPMPTYFPLSGKGGSYTVAEGGGWGDIMGVARVGETVFIAINSPMIGAQLFPIRGPKLVRHLQTAVEAGCKADEARQEDYLPPPPAIIPDALESTPAGSLISVGRLCRERGVVAEIWDKEGKSKVVDLGAWWKKANYPRLLKGAGDELWLYGGTWAPVVLRYKDGEITPLPELGWPIQAVFTSPQGELFASDGRVIHRFDGKAWAPAFRLPDDGKVGDFAMDEKGTLYSAFGAPQRLEPGPGVAPPEGCTTPFVYLYASSYKNDKKFTYPATRKALATFPEAADLGLVEFGPEYGRHLGIKVKSRAQADAVIAHVKATMKDEDPRYFCHDPKDVRLIPLDAK